MAMSDPIFLQIADELRRLRVAKKLTQKQVAKRIGTVTWRSVSTWEMGIRSPIASNAMRWAESLGKHLVLR